jgi:UDPglucose--hexose-1-phosphate uridylyltransferase
MELRWDPTLSEWIIVSGARKERPVTPEERCPFCPDSKETPKSGWKVLCLSNKFPALLPKPPAPDVKWDRFYRCRPSEGECEVIIYTPDHNGSLTNLSAEHIGMVIELWAQRYRVLSRRDYVKYVLIFENKGREIGTTLDHPHGQIYAIPFVPPLIKNELSSSREFWKRNRTCLFCRIVEKEISQALRIISENESFVCFLPFFAHWPYGVQVYSKRHLQAITDLTRKERGDLALMLKDILTRFDNLFNMSFPYMMVMHQRPTDGKPYHHYHFHIEFYPIYREKGKIKNFASVEMGAGTVTFDYNVEEKAKELRETPGTT